MIFIVNGPPGSGKDEACIYFASLGYIHSSFKRKLIEETVEYFDVTTDWFLTGYDIRLIKERPEEKLSGLSRRQALIHVSEDLIKPRYGNDYFGKMAAADLVLEKNYCFSDGGFVEELVPIINKLGAENIILIQLTREGCDFTSDSRRYINGNLIKEYILGAETPIKEQYILEQIFPIRTYRVHNNSTVSDFHTVLKQIHEKEANGRKINKETGCFI